MNRFIHIAYLLLIVVSLFIGFSIGKQKRDKVSLPTEKKMQEVQKKEKICEEIKEKPIFNQPISKDENILNIIEKDINQTKIIETKNRHIENNMISIAQELAIDDEEMQEHIKDNTVYTFLEEKLLDNILEEEGLDLIESYLYAYPKEVSEDFISELTQNAQDMQSRDKIDFLTLMKESVVASRGYNRPSYTKNIIQSIQLFTTNSDEEVRVASLNALEESIEDKTILKNSLSDFEDDTSAIIQAKLLLIKNELLQK